MKDPTTTNAPPDRIEATFASMSAQKLNACERPVLSLDPKKYEGHFRSTTISEADQRELLETLWKIMIAFVDIGFSVDRLEPVISGIFADSGELIHNNNEKIEKEE